MAQYVSCARAARRGGASRRARGARAARVHGADLLARRVRVRSLLRHLRLRRPGEVVAEGVAEVHVRVRRLVAEPARGETSAPAAARRDAAGPRQWCMASMSTSTSFRSRALRASASSGVSPSTGGAPARASRLTSTTAAARRMALDRASASLPRRPGPCRGRVHRTLVAFRRRSTAKMREEGLLAHKITSPRNGAAPSAAPYNMLKRNL